MLALATILTVVIPPLLLAIPGLALALLFPAENLLSRTARAVLWSWTILSLGTFAMAGVGHTPLAAVLLAAVVAVVVLWQTRKRWQQHRHHWPALVLLALGVLCYAGAALPFVLYHEGLPTGDSQKAIIWALDVVSNNDLPNYQLSQDLLNRDPVDFFTPALHTLTAAVMQLTPIPLTAVGFFAIAASLAVAVIAAAIASLVFPRLPRWYLAGTAAALLLTQLRFLRYLREPGYHFQNVVGELLLFGALLLGLALLKRWRWTDALLLALTLLTLALTHQFSAFIAAFVLLPVALVWLWHHRQHLTTQNIPRLLLLLTPVILIVVAGFRLGLHRKINDIFTREPHLLPLTPFLSEYATLMGGIWLTLAAAGLALGLRSLHRQTNRVQMAFFGSSALLLALSQGPRWGLDIPPVRALFYLAVPGSILGGYFLVRLVTAFWRRGTLRRLSVVALIFVAALGSWQSSWAAWQLSHEVRTNSTLLPSQLDLVTGLRQLPQDEGVLIDDYNRRSTSWLVLSGHPLFTRLAADVSRQMAEAEQSVVRSQLYLKQLDYEKIFALASWPAATELMAKHNIGIVTGIAGSSAYGFKQNPALQQFAQAGDSTLFTITESNRAGCSAPSPERVAWLLRASTLVNDLGDREDTFAHLPASIQASRLSGPAGTVGCTWRSSSAPAIPLHFNVGDYVELLWDQEQTNRPDVSVELYLPAPPGREALTIQTPTGETFVLPADESSLVIPPHAVPFNDDGGIVLTLINPSQRPLSLDLIALGLARTP